jgi:hypothetical protein
MFFIKNQTPYKGKLKLKFEKYPHYSNRKNKLNKVHLNLGFTKLVSRIKINDIKTDDGYVNDVIPALIGSQQQNQSDAFKTKDIDLSSYVNQTIKVRFRAVRGDEWDSDIAIDNVFIKTIITPMSSKNVIVYPNPVKNDLLYIKTNSKEPLNFQISNLTGNVFMSGTLINQPINMSKLASGMYLLTVISQHSKVTKKIIK